MATKQRSVRGGSLRLAALCRDFAAPSPFPKHFRPAPSASVGCGSAAMAHEFDCHFTTFGMNASPTEPCSTVGRIAHDEASNIDPATDANKTL